MSRRGSAAYESMLVISTSRSGPRGRARRVLGLPLRLAGVLRGHRSAIPAPWLYVAAAVIGLGVGLAVYFALDWVWWPFALAAVLVVAVIFAATGLRGPHRRAEVAADLKTALLWTLSPRRAREHDRRADARYFARAPFPLYGLPREWPGLRYFASRGSSGDGRITELELGHREPAGPSLCVEVSAGAVEPGELEFEVSVHAGDDPGPEPDWTPITLRVDGEELQFNLFGEPERWWATREFDGYAVILHAENFPVVKVELVRITDLEPYERGSAQLAEMP